MENWLISIADIRARIERARREEDGRYTDYPICHGTMRVGLSAPRGVNVQQPHSQDELYIVSRGTGIFVKGSERRPFQPGDVIFVEAGAPHHFEDFSGDFETWVVFWGPEGGEK